MSEKQKPLIDRWADDNLPFAIVKKAAKTTEEESKESEQKLLKDKNSND